MGGRVINVLLEKFLGGCDEFIWVLLPILTNAPAPSPPPAGLSVVLTSPTLAYAFAFWRFLFASASTAGN
jgi:hypothetical protein